MSESYSERFMKETLYNLWSALPELQAGAVVDPFDFKQRMAVYKLLIESMNARGVFGQENEWNIFWGYVFQLEWQWRSGRLCIEGTPESGVDPNSMWGYANYTLSVIPYMAAVQAGVAPDIEFLSPKNSDVEYGRGGGKSGAYQLPTIFDKAMSAWQEFFKAVLTFQPGRDIEPVRFIQWKAHYASLTASEHNVLLLGKRYYAKDELDFLLGWIRMVDFLGSAAWRTDLIYMLENGVGTLPPRVITAGDVPGKVADMDERINNNLKNIIGLTRQSKLRFDFNLYLWKRAMRSRQARDEVLPMLDATFNPSPQNVKERRKLLRYMMAL